MLILSLQYYHHGQSQALSSILYTKGAIAVSGSRQNVSCLKRSEGFVYECYGNIKETSVLAYIA